MKTVHAVYENGVFRPTERVDLPEHSEVEFELRRINGVSDEARAKATQEIFRILSQSDETGIPDLAARHGEHQP
jgi:predicted DNA-binding antitoxin AbrB/MazE fold protein